MFAEIARFFLGGTVNDHFGLFKSGRSIRVGRTNTDGLKLSGFKNEYCFSCLLARTTAGIIAITC
jgi:hypothetical protein